MTLERRDPLPKGRYWIDVYEPLAEGKEDGIIHFNSWVQKNASSLEIEKVQEFRGAFELTGDLIQPTDLFTISGFTEPKRQFTVFKVLKPIPWGQQMSHVVGWPTIAGKDVSDSESTAQRPEAEKLPGVWESAVEGISNVTGHVGEAVGKITGAASKGVATGVGGISKGLGFWGWAAVIVGGLLGVGYVKYKVSGIVKHH